MNIAGGEQAAMKIAGDQRHSDADVRTTGVIPAEWVVVQLFSMTIQYRTGWRRYVWIRPLLRWRLARRDIPAQAEEAFSDRSGRLLAQRLGEATTS
jgi:hypothetical protein